MIKVSNSKRTKIIENMIIIILTILTEFISIKFVRPKVFTGFIFSQFSYWFINIIFVITLLFVYKIIFWLYKKIKLKNKFYIKFIKYSIIYFVFMTIYMLLIYPGTWLYDEFWVIEYVVNYMLEAWQSYLSVILYTFSFYIIPHPIGILIFQLIGISFIMGYVQTRLSDLFNKRIYNLIFYAIFLTPVFFVNNLYILRTTLYSYIVLMFFANIIFDYLEKRTLTKKKLVFLLFLTFLMIIWRSEGIIFYIFNFLCIILVYPNVRKIKNIAIMFLCVLIPSTLYSKIGANKMYSATITVLPLSIMLNENLQGENIEQDIQNINKVFDVEKMKLYPNYHFMESFWDGNIEQINAEQNIDFDFYKNFANIVLNNLGKFLDVRFKVFLYTFENIEYPNNCYRAYLTNYTMPETPTRIIANTVERFDFKALNLDLKMKIEFFLIENKIIKIIFWNIIPFGLGVSLLLILITKMKKKEWLMVVIILSLFAKMGITFLTSTASYFMYYFTEYVAGAFIVCLNLFLLLEKRKIGEEL